jgi:DNA-binding beta-propeller fold protein YncE
MFVIVWPFVQRGSLNGNNNLLFGTSCGKAAFSVMNHFTQMSKITMTFRQFSPKKLLWMALPLLWLSCSEVPLITSQGESRLDSPSSMVLLSGTDCAILANANVNLDQPKGSLVAVSLVSNQLLLDTEFKIPNFAGDLFVDEGRGRLYIPDRDEALLIYDYEITGTDCSTISFSEKNVPTPIDLERPNGVETDDGPAQALMISGTTQGDLIFVANQRGSVGVVKATDLKLKDMDDEEKYFGIRLFSAANFESADNFPGRGAGRMVASPTTGLIYITSSINNQIYVLNPDTLKVEAMIDLDGIASPTVGMRDIAFDSSTGSELAYVAHSGLDSIVVLDVSGIAANGINYELVAPPILDVITVGDGPEDIEITSNGLFLFVSNQLEDSVYMVDTTQGQTIKKVYLDIAKNPSRLILDEPRNTLFSLDFYSNSITLFDATTGDRTGTIQ